MSAILCTARDDHPLPASPDWHVLGGPAACLAAQTHRDFEWIVVDLGIDGRRDWFAAHPQPFPVRHVPIKPNYWTAHGRRARAASLNTGIEAARGDLLVFFDDGWTFPPDWIERMWARYREGSFVASLYKTASAPGAPPVWNDGRERYVSGGGGTCSTIYPGYPPTYGGLSVSAEAARRLGGYEELMDAGWGLEDIEFGHRLQAAGYRVLLDEHIYIVAHPTGPLLVNVIRDDRNTLCCENLLRWKIDRIARGEHRSGIAPTDTERARFLPQCVYLQPNASCAVYGPEHPCSQAPHVQRPDPASPDIRQALYGGAP